MKKVIFLLIFPFFLNSCLFTISKQDIETPFDTIRTLQWALNKIEKADFFNIMYELFVDDGDKIVKQLETLEQSKKPEEQKLWKKIQGIFKNVIIKLDKLEGSNNVGLAMCSYFFPENYYMTQVKIQLKKTKDGWKITNIEGLLPPSPPAAVPPAATPADPAAQTAPVVPQSSGVRIPVTQPQR